MFFVFAILPPQIWGIRVAELAMDGRHSIEPYINYTIGIGPKNLTDFTLCLRFNVNFLRPIVSSVLSYSTFLSDNALNFEIYRTSSGGLELWACKYSKISQVCIVQYNKLKKVVYQGLT